MSGHAAPGETSPGLPTGLRSLVLVHERELLGQGASVLNVVEPLGDYRWPVTGWLRGDGLPAAAASERLAAVGCAVRPIAASMRGWRDDRVRENQPREPVIEARADSPHVGSA